MSVAVGPNEVCESVRAVVLARLEACGSEPITTSYSGVGLIAVDDCCGQLVVAPERVFRSEEFPLEATTDERCGAATVGIEMLVTLARCVPSPDDRGRAPSAAELSLAHKQILDDAAIVWAAVTDASVLDVEWDRAGVSQTFSGNEGGCVSIDTRLVVGISAAQWCLDGC